MKKYDGKSNVIGQLVHKYRLDKKYNKAELSRKLELHAVYLDTTEIKRIENGQMIVKDFEIIGLCKVLDIDYEDLKNTIE